MPPIPEFVKPFLSFQVAFFALFALGAIATAVIMVLNPNPIRSALFLVLNLFTVAILYLLLNAYFLAAVQIIVYAGAIMVLFLFVIMLLNLGTPDRAVDKLRWQQPVAVLGGIVLAGVIGAVIATSVPTPSLEVRRDDHSAAPEVGALTPAGGGPAPEAPAADETVPPRPNAAPAPVIPLPDPNQVDAEPITPENMGTAISVGRNLYDPMQPWLFPFEMTSILLLIAVIGSVVLAKRRIPGDEE